MFCYFMATNCNFSIKIIKSMGSCKFRPAAGSPTKCCLLIYIYIYIHTYNDKNNDASSWFLMVDDGYIINGKICLKKLPKLFNTSVPGPACPSSPNLWHRLNLQEFLLAHHRNTGRTFLPCTQSQPSSEKI